MRNYYRVTFFLIVTTLRFVAVVVGQGHNDGQKKTLREYRGNVASTIHENGTHKSRTDRRSWPDGLIDIRKFYSSAGFHAEISKKKLTR